MWQHRMTLGGNSRLCDVSPCWRLQLVLDVPAVHGCRCYTGSYTATDVLSTSTCMSSSVKAERYFMAAAARALQTCTREGRTLCCHVAPDAPARLATKALLACCAGATMRLLALSAGPAQQQLVVCMHNNQLVTHCLKCAHEQQPEEACRKASAPAGSCRVGALCCLPVLCRKPRMSLPRLRHKHVPDSRQRTSSVTSW